MEDPADLTTVKNPKRAKDLKHPIPKQPMPCIAKVIIQMLNNEYMLFILVHLSAITGPIKQPKPTQKKRVPRRLLFSASLISNPSSENETFNTSDPP